MRDTDTMELQTRLERTEVGTQKRGNERKGKPPAVRVPYGTGRSDPFIACTEASLESSILESALLERTRKYVYTSYT